MLVDCRDITFSVVSFYRCEKSDDKKEWINLGSAGGSSDANSGPSSNVVGEGEAGSMIIHDGEAAEPTADVGQADSMVLGE